MSDGNRLTIGQDGFANYSYQNSVEIYELDLGLSDWKMIGNITNYSPPVQSDLSPDIFAYYLHDAVLSGDGQVLVTGTSKHDLISNANGTYDVELSYITHKWNSTIGSWDVMDDKGGLLSKTRVNQFPCMAVSDDGTVLAVCSNPGIEVYSWNADKSSWIPRDVVFACNETCQEYYG